MHSKPHLPLVSLLLVGTSFGCGSFDELGAAIGNPPKNTFETPGRLMLTGRYKDLMIEGTNASGAYVVAQRRDQHLMFMPFDGDQECVIGPYAGYGPLLKRASEDTTAPAKHLLRPVLLKATDTEPSRLVFTDLDCKLSDISFETPHLPLSYSFTQEGELLVLDGADTLWNVNPWTGAKDKVADKVSALASNGTRTVFGRGPDNDPWVYTLEKGEIVARDKTFKEVFRASKDVQEMYYHVDSEGDVMLGLRRDSTWYGLHVAEPEEEFVIAENACRFRVNEGKLGREAYYLDCATNSLMLYRFETEERHLLGENVQDYRTFGKASDGPVLMYWLLDEAPDDVMASAYARWGLQTPSFLGDNTNFKLSSLDDKGTQTIVNEWKKVDGVSSGVLKVGKVGEDPKTIATGVVSVSSRNVIHDFDGANGTFSRRSGDLGTTLTTIHERVFPDGIRVDDERERMLMLTDYDPETDSGDLTIVEKDEPRLLSQNSAPWAYQFSGNENLISVLTDHDEDKNGFTLNMARLNRPGAIEIDDGVVESLEIPWPQKGLLYVVATEDREGLYFSQAE